MPKPKITRTYGPIHFEDLDPHRFEDLVRELIYDYKDWQSIEATGRSGNDGGFDVRAYEKVGTPSQSRDEDEEQEEAHPMSGNLWMIQGKREKELGPKRVKEILIDVDSKNSPYGYILAASANFSKDSYDVFREELRKKGVTEFYLWGKAELEDMLHLPKNDRILFAFFGISLVSKRRSRATEIRQVVINKNKLYKIFGEGTDFYKSVLLRDSKDSKYPYKADYKDFEKHPRWREYKAIDYHPSGLIVALRKNFAYVDIKKKEYDYIEVVNLIYKESDSQEVRNKQQIDRGKIENFWEYLPRHNQATYFRNGLIRYDEMLVIDDKGDNSHKFPHIFVDYNFRTGPIAGSYEYLELGEKKSISLKDFKRVNKFPKKFSAEKFGKIHDDKDLGLEKFYQHRLNHGDEGFYCLYDIDGKFSFLNVRDVVGIPHPEDSKYKNYIKITHKESISFSDYLEKNPNREHPVQEMLGHKPNPEDIINIYEFKKTFEWEFKKDNKIGFS